jgi:hypothetical protein
MSTEPLSPAVLKIAARDRISNAMDRIQRAQNELASACADLSALRGGVPVWRACSALHDKVHALWYRVDTFRASGKYSLDALHVDVLQRHADSLNSKEPV